MTRVHVVSDVHGAAEDLAAAGEGCDAFVCLGDLILFLDYDDPGRGIFADLFGEEHARRYIALRTARRYDEARALSSAAWDALGVTESAGRWGVMAAKVREQYAALFTEMPRDAYLTYGNVDIPALWEDFRHPSHHVVDGGTVEIGGLRVGMVGGGLISPMRTPFELTPEAYAAKVAALGEVDVLMTHIPPAVPTLTYDTVARRFEHGSAALAEYVRDVQPRLHLFGHVHQPLVARARIGRTECVNVGHFNATRRPYVVTW
jgi:Icc-related predicted phosphoesterase